ncbi:S8 family serine peptidase [Bradyrhizobium sp. LHD-71]|uniref:S8 family serine peptidase n=1 Tax=Bradyrhizobium sp. LHD-71 TaxID=3072141 RepID=UPI00280ED155|nr:S8 family serine peptidase [Bradyrhizobium sp. LHD-71]MDQ8728105.1 S8 family serine peptidase [Bradyrhizobium sp. LHD-71]
MKTVIVCRLFATVVGLFLGFAGIDQSPTYPALFPPAFADDDGGSDGGGGGAGGGGASGGGGGDSGGGGALVGSNWSPVGRGRGSRHLFAPFRGFRLVLPWDARPRRTAQRAQAREYVLSGIEAAQAQTLRDRGFRVVAERVLSGGRGALLRVAAPSRMSKQRALASLREITPGQAVDENSLYLQRFRMQGSRSTLRNAFLDPLATVDWRSLENCGDLGAIGLVDTGIDTNHAGLASKQLEVITQRTPDRRASSKRHGTAVATLLLGDGVFPGLTPKARIVAVDAFHAKNGGDQIDTFDLVSAMDTLVERGVAVINLSLAGPANEVLDAEGQRARARGVIVVAASGNDGAAVKPRYPAAYPWAVAATAIDKNLVVYNRAVRGPHIRLAAPGVDLALRDGDGTLRQHTGTSFAAPFVAARMALAHLGKQVVPAAAAAPPTDDVASPRAAEASIAMLVRQAIDLGEPGKDTVYGDGLVQFGSACRSATQ